ncbi:YkgJ family cysteine cluster protein [Methanofollis tationis]|uniref:YkgJ family cysteine cluster protein n=1 Tax=Methanofollis tationis TaxID=81417 RepID=A0A7K4HRM5_9EURY|nr:YkgJ family cysteine cluster protein [Methanofollis tationis]NVO67906.1 YkgJ family cysteine cluster protein [Methanofollis tationis]
MRTLDALADEIMATGFRCTGCGACCSEVSPGSNLVMVTPAEARAVADAAGRTFDGVAEPYPDFIEGEDGARYTFDWSLRREGGRCLFLREGRCTVYGARPWICRTYPFMLDGDRLAVFECPGLGGEMSREEARLLAALLIGRQEAEEAEEEGIRKVLASTAVPAGICAVVDSEGVWPVHG